MSIVTEILRLNNAKEDIKSSIEDKGVNIPNNATLDEYSTYIDNISTGSTSKWGELTNENYEGTTTRWSANSLIKNIIIPKEVQTIESFANNKNLESVIFENGSICTGGTQSNLFQNCTKLKNITFPNTFTAAYQGSTFYGATALESANIPSGTTVIGSRSFLDCRSLKSITIPNTVTRIWQNSFSNCSSLESVIFEENSVLTQIDGWDFNYCTSLKSIDIPDSVTTLGSSNFAYDSELESVHLPTGISIISDEIFRYCSKLKTINIPNVTSIGKNAFEQTALESITIPDTVTILYNSIFLGCTSLKTAVIGSGVTTNYGWTFSNCTNLNNITIKEGCTVIGTCMFTNCNKLTEITLPSTITSIGNEAFRLCSSLISVTILATTPPTLSNANAFMDTNNCIIYVPSGSVNTYKAASYWSNLSSRIQAIPN